VRFEHNRVHDNGGAGVNLSSNNAQQNTVSENSIFNNTGLGIEIAPAGVNANDLAADCADGLPDCDSGPNGRQNAPVLDAATSTWSGHRIHLRGSLASRPGQTYTIEFFMSPAAHPSGYGEGKIPLGSVEVTTDAGGNALFTAALLGKGSAHHAPLAGFFTATATDPSGATSEFSQAIELAR
jgi:hypothetical protein